MKRHQPALGLSGEANVVSVYQLSILIYTSCIGNNIQLNTYIITTR